MKEETAKQIHDLVANTLLLGWELVKFAVLLFGLGCIMFFILAIIHSVLS